MEFIRTFFFLFFFFLQVTTPETTAFSSIITKICVLLHFAGNTSFSLASRVIRLTRTTLARALHACSTRAVDHARRAMTRFTDTELCQLPCTFPVNKYRLKLQLNAVAGEMLSRIVCPGLRPEKESSLFSEVLCSISRNRLLIS